MSVTAPNEKRVGGIIGLDSQIHIFTRVIYDDLIAGVRGQIKVAAPPVNSSDVHDLIQFGV
jgi:hypothetical protein